MIKWRQVWPNWQSRWLSDRFALDLDGQVWRLTLIASGEIIHESRSIKQCKAAAEEYLSTRQQWRNER